MYADALVAACREFIDCRHEVDRAGVGDLDVRVLVGRELSKQRNGMSSSTCSSSVAIFWAPIPHGVGVADHPAVT